MTDPVEPVDLAASPASPAQDMREEVYAALRDTDKSVWELQDRLDAIESEQIAVAATASRNNRLYTAMAAGAILALAVFLAFERLNRKGA